MAGNDGTLNFDTKIDSTGFEKGLSSIGKGLSITTKVLEGAAAGVTALAGAAIKVGSDFEAACSQIAATMGVTTDEISDLVAKAEEMGSTTAFSATEAAQGLNILAMSGLTAEEQMAAIGDVLNLAAAGSLSLESAAAYTTGTVKGFADSMDNAQKYADMIAKGATLANTDVNGLGEALSSSAATAKSYGQEVDGATLSLLRLAEQNVTGAEAATALNRAMMDVYTPTASAKKALDALGISAYDSSGRAKEFNLIVDELSDALSSMSDEEANAAKNAIFTSYGLQAFNKMTVSSTEKVEEFKDGLAHASDGIGSAAQQAETMIDNLQGQLTILQSGLEGLGVSMYKTMQDTAKEVVKEAQDMVQQLRDAFNEGGFEGLVGSVGNVLTQIVQRIANAAPMVIEVAVSLVKSFCDGLKNAPGIGESGAKLITSLVTGLMSCASEMWTTAIILAGKLAEGIAAGAPQMIQAASMALTDIIECVIDWMPDILQAGADIILALVDGAASALPTLFRYAAVVMSTLFDGLMAVMPQITSAGVSVLNQLASGISSSLPGLIPVAMNALVEFSGSLRENAALLVDAGLNLIMTLAQSLIDNLPVFIETVPTIVTNIAGIINDNAPKLLMAGIELIAKLAMGLVQAIPTLVSNIPQIIQAVVSVFTAFNWLELGANIITFIKDGVKSLAHSIPEAVRGIGQTAMDWMRAINWSTLGADIIDLIVIGVRSLLTVIPDLLKSIGQSAVEFFKSIDWLDLGVNVVKGIASGITGALDGLWSSLGNMCSGMLDKVKGFFGIHSPSTVMAEQGDFLVQGLVNGIASMPAELTQYLDQTVQRITAWGQQMLSSIQGIMQKVLNTIVASMSQLPGKVWIWLVNTVAKVMMWGQQMVNAAKTAISNMISAIISLLSELPGKVWIQLVNVLTKVAQWGQQMVEAARTAANNVVSTIISALSELPGKVSSELEKVTASMIRWGTDICSRMTEVGKNIVAGIWQGISNDWPWLEKKVAELANSLLTTTKKELGVNSPSKRFRDEFGKWLMPGAMEGVEKSMPKTLQEMKGHAGELLAMMKGTVDASIGEIAMNVSGSAGALALHSGGTIVYNDNHQEQENNYNVPVVTPGETAKANREAFRKMFGRIK